MEMLGRKIAHWEIVRLLGEGAFGSVYEARHVTIAGRRAALKVLHSQMSLRPDIKRRFVNEASAASRAEHENIIQVFDGGETEDGLCYVVMELLKGKTLCRLLSEGKLDAARTVKIGLQIASGLHAAHSLNIVHRDLKPENIFILNRFNENEFVKILDFGIAKLCDDERFTKTGTWMGTPAYMSPEQWQTLPDIDARSDLYSLGVILFECVVGAQPFQGTTPYSWLLAHLNTPVPDPSASVSLPDSLRVLIMRLLAKDRELRPQSAVEVIAELKRCVASPTDQTVSITSLPTLPSSRAGVTTAPRSIPPPPRCKRMASLRRRSVLCTRAPPFEGPGPTSCRSEPSCSSGGSPRWVLELVR